jgi:hypothetical protein
MKGEKTRVCKDCGVKKTLEEFCKHKNSKDGRLNSCRECKKAYLKSYYRNNPEKFAKFSRERWIKDKEKWTKYNAEYYKKFSRQIKIAAKQYRDGNRDKINKYKNERMKNDPIYKLSCLVRGHVNHAFKLIKQNKTGKTLKLLGCSFSELKEHVEKQFKTGMNWGNHKRDGWHIDHRIPLASAKNKKDLLKLCHYLNLQPLWAEENMSKHDKIIN